jgi:predicted RNase H-like nuclease (RuvC/YqgF family)
MSNDTDNEVVDAETPELDPVIEKEARQNGWVPQEQFRGEPEDWMDAPAFVKKGREINPILRKNNERLQRELDSNKAELKELQLTTKEFAAEFAKMKENAYKRAIADLKAQRREALKEDDHTLVDELEERIDTLKEEQAKKPEPKKETTGPDMTVLNAWRQENQWYDEAREPDLFDAAEAAALRISRTTPGLTGRGIPG